MRGAGSLLVLAAAIPRYGSAPGRTLVAALGIWTLVSACVFAALELDALLEGALDSALRVCGADTGYVTMSDWDGSSLEIRARRGTIPKRVTEAQIETSMAGWVVRESRPLIINPSRDDEGIRVDTITGAIPAETG